MWFYYKCIHLLHSSICCLDHWLRMHTSNARILLQLHSTSNAPKAYMQTADSGVTVTSLALQGIYVPHTVTAVSRRLLGRFTICLAL